MSLCVSPALRSRRSRLAPTGRQGQRDGYRGDSQGRQSSGTSSGTLRRMWHCDFTPPSPRHPGSLRYPDRKGPMCSETQGHTALPLSRFQVQFAAQHRPYAHPTPVVKENPPHLFTRDRAGNCADTIRNPAGRQGQPNWRAIQRTHRNSGDTIRNSTGR